MVLSGWDDLCRFSIIFANVVHDPFFGNCISVVFEKAKVGDKVKMRWSVNHGDGAEWQRGVVTDAT